MKLRVEALEVRDTPAIIGSPGFPPPLAVSGPMDGVVTLYAPIISGSQYNPIPAATVVPFPGFPVTVRTAFGDVNGDQILDLVAMTGPGVPSRVAVIDGRDFTRVLVQPFDPFGGNFIGGGFVTTGDFNSDGRAELVASPDLGGGPRVTVFNVVGGGVQLVTSFLGIDDPNFRGGARVAAGDFNRDGFADIAVAAGYGGGPRVAVYNGRFIFGNTGTPPKLLGDFFAFPGADATTLRNGAYIAAGDLNADGFVDLIFGGGPGGGPRVRALNGALLTNGNDAVAQANPMVDFFVGDPNTRGGIRVAGKPTGAGFQDAIATGSGMFLESQIGVFLASRIVTGLPPTVTQVFDPYGQVLIDGVYVG